MLSLLINDLQLLIFENLDTYTLCMVCLVSKTINALLHKDSPVWKTVYKNQWLKSASNEFISGFYYEGFDWKYASQTRKRDLEVRTFEQYVEILANWVKYMSKLSWRDLKKNTHLERKNFLFKERSKTALLLINAETQHKDMLKFYIKYSCIIRNPSRLADQECRVKILERGLKLSEPCNVFCKLHLASQIATELKHCQTAEELSVMYTYGEALIRSALTKYNYDALLTLVYITVQTAHLLLRKFGVKDVVKHCENVRGIFGLITRTYSNVKKSDSYMLKFNFAVITKIYAEVHADRDARLILCNSAEEILKDTLDNLKGRTEKYVTRKKLMQYFCHFSKKSWFIQFYNKLSY